jgi:heme exporter protein D
MNWNLNWSHWSDFLAMGGYGLYVWGSFGVTALVMLIEVWSLAARRKAVQRSAAHAAHVAHEHPSNLENS